MSKANKKENGHPVESKKEIPGQAAEQINDNTDSFLANLGFDRESLSKCIDEQMPAVMKAFIQKQAKATQGGGAAPVIPDAALKKAIEKIKEEGKKAPTSSGKGPREPSKEVQEQLKILMEGVVANGLKPKDFLGLTDENMEAIYGVAYNFYQGGKYEEAHRFFQLLCTCDLSQTKYWMGLGACRQMMKEYEPAILAYAFASVVEDDINPTALYSAGECFLALDIIDRAEAAMDAVVSVAEDKKQYEDLVKKAKAIKEILVKKKAAATPAKK